MKDAWSSVEEECILTNGFASISEALRTSSTVDKLPSRYVKSIDWMRMRSDILLPLPENKKLI